MPREAMTHELWMRLWTLHWGAARRREPTADLDGLRRRVREAMTETFGPCPPEPPSPPKPPIPVRMGLWALKKKLGGLPSVEVPMFVKKLIVSLVYGIGASGPVLQLALNDSTISGNEWGAILSAFVAAFWGAFKSNTTVIAPSRKGETITGTNGA